jgi:hypothetical protein
MRSLAPVLVRPSLRAHPLRASLAGHLAVAQERASDGASGDLRLFLNAWLGGLVFFGTLLA